MAKTITVETNNDDSIFTFHFGEHYSAEELIISGSYELLKQVIELGCANLPKDFVQITSKIKLQKPT